MVEPIRNPQKLQEQISQYQELIRQLQIYDAQEQQITFLLNDLEQAEAELKKSSGQVFKAAGNLLIETTKKEAFEDINEKKDVYQTRIKAIKKQQEQLKQKIESLKKEIESQLQQNPQT
jgi:prefoldin beta subunit